MRKIILLFTFAVLCISSKAYHAQINKIYYNLDINTKTAEVTGLSDDINGNGNAYYGDIVIPPTITYNNVSYDVTTIGKFAFRNCSGVTSVDIPSSILAIKSEAFANCTGIKSILIPDGVKTLEGWIFYGCTNLKSISISKTVLSVGSNVFYGCTALDNCRFEDGSNRLLFEDNSNNDKHLFTDCPLSSLYLGRNLEYNGSPFYNKATLKQVEIGDSVSLLSSRLFERCSGLSSIVFPNALLSIGLSTFQGCNSLTSIIIPDNVTSIGPYAFADCVGLQSVKLGNGVKNIRDYVFGGNTHLSSLTIGTNVNEISAKAFHNDSYYASYNKPIKTIWLTNTPPSGYTNAEGAMNYVSNELYVNLKTKKVYPFLSSLFESNGIKYVPTSPSERKCDAIDCVYDASAKSIALTPKVSYRGINMDLVEIMPYLCCRNQYIVDVHWDMANDIPNNSFQTCKSLKDFIIGDSVTSIGASALSNCVSLIDFVIPTSVKTIEKGALSDCSSLASITIPQSVTTINYSVFDGCTSLKSVIIQDRDIPLVIGTSFNSCPLDTVFIGGKISYANNNSPFAQNVALRSVTITEKETNIYKSEFMNCTNLQNVWIGDGVTTIDERAFSGCKSLKFFSFGSKLNSIGKEAFSDCVSISVIISKAATPPVCGSQALDDINKWECKLIVPMGSLELYQKSDQWKEFFFFEEASNIKSVIHGDGQFNRFNSIYNLKGQKTPNIENIRQLSNGVYIINGKKVKIK